MELWFDQILLEICHNLGVPVIPTFALHSLAKKTLEQPLAVLTDGGPGVGVDGEGVRHFDPTQHHLLHPDGPAAPRQDPLPRLLVSALLQGREIAEREGWKEGEEGGRGEGGRGEDTARSQGWEELKNIWRKEGGKRPQRDRWSE